MGKTTPGRPSSDDLGSDSSSLLGRRLRYGRRFHLVKGTLVERSWRRPFVRGRMTPHNKDDDQRSQDCHAHQNAHEILNNQKKETEKEQGPSSKSRAKKAMSRPCIVRHSSWLKSTGIPSW